MPCTKRAVACRVTTHAANYAQVQEETIGGHAVALADVFVIAPVPAPSRLEMGAVARAGVHRREPGISMSEPPTAVFVTF